MYRPIPEHQIEKAKKLLTEGHSLRSTEFLSGLSFTKVRQIFREMNGITETREEENEFFKVENTCWLTGIKLNS